MEEAEIINRIKKGETALFSEIIKLYKGVVFGHCLSFLRNRQDAEDVCQEVFVSVFNNLKKFRGDSKLGTWIYRITVNSCKNRLKQMQRLRSRMAEENYSPNEEEEINAMVNNIKEKEENEPDNLFVSKEIRAAVFKRIGELTEEQRQVIILRDVDGLPYDVIGKVLKLSVSAVKSKLFRARENLREKLEKDKIL
ncbi:MAG TPA: sigma-70 family RNA polymerase sigma factor [Candidatus Goldiibacteriota bacterium]|nr:sigma-70 family RNA polymerase sigma factor [Candidatus Goldiibacteriota bacterium]HPN64075.1 sigma-70 family RNA polymerase sigma factor [Candidatus Goldiibacteriota bacterium]HRQ43624.1 sigma-70 family RNA polymerase sigma factor [Candidatus Goldiibacteriota bacterium]